MQELLSRLDETDAKVVIGFLIAKLVLSAFNSLLDVIKKVLELRD